jgi:hypothetical protein
MAVVEAYAFAGAGFVVSDCENLTTIGTSFPAKSGDFLPYGHQKAI